MNTDNPFSEWMDNHIKEIAGGEMKKVTKTDKGRAPYDALTEAQNSVAAVVRLLKNMTPQEVNDARVALGPERDLWSEAYALKALSKNILRSVYGAQLLVSIAESGVEEGWR
ncbi:MAG: hypothetical protein PUA61_08280 [Succinatimonas hippei]|nr:hypothetical protein [Succinatimonas hippei]